MDVQVKQLKPMRVAYIRHLGPYEECGKVWDKLFDWAADKGIYPKSTFWIGASYDDPENTPPEKLRYDACVIVSNEIGADDTVQIQELPGGRFASTVHKGAYRNMGQTFRTMFQEGLPKAGLNWRKGPCLEFYTGEYDDRPEEDLITELYVPVK